MSIDTSVLLPTIVAPLKVAVVTGASAGIGLEIARGRAAQGATVALVGRNRERTEAARAAVGADAVFLADFAKLSDVRAVAAQLAAQYPRIDILVNNAGLALWRRTVTADGFETTFAVNHLAPFLLTNLLLPNLRAAPSARIVTVASSAHKRGRLDFDNLQRERGYLVYEAYAQSKLANIVFTRELARRIVGSGVTATCCHPGVVATHLWEVHPLLRLAAPLLGRFMLSATQGADTPLWLATAPDMEGQTGGYYARRTFLEPAPAARDAAAAARLWDLSARLVGLPLA